MFLPSGQGVTHPASRHRLEKLIAERLEPNADKAAIDRRIWDLLGEEWAVMFTDLSGFSRKVVEFGIIQFLQTIYESVLLFVPLIDANDGILLKAEADSLLVIFRSADRALSCAVAMQHASTAYNVTAASGEEVLVCIGLGYGAMLRIGDEDVFGAEVNAASKLGEDIAKAGEILVTEDFRQKLSDISGLVFSRRDDEVHGAGATYAVGYPLQVTCAAP